MRPLLPTALAAVLLSSLGAQAATLKLDVDHSTRLAISGHAASVVVGNPAVADVTVVDSRTIYVSGRGLGATDVSVLDPIGRVLFSGEIVVGHSGDAVSVFRGPDRTDLACEPYCTITHSDQAASKAPASPPSAPAAVAAALTAPSRPMSAAVPALTTP